LFFSRRALTQLAGEWPPKKCSACFWRVFSLLCSSFIFGKGGNPGRQAQTCTHTHTESHKHNLELARI